MTERVDLQYRPDPNGWPQVLTTMQRSHDFNTHDHSADGIFDDRADMTQEFWGTSRGWSPETGRIERQPSGADDTTGAIRAIRDGVTAFRPHRIERRDPSGEVQRTRVHGASRSTEAPSPAPRRRETTRDEFTPRRREVTLGELAGGGTIRHRPDVRNAVAYPDDIWPEDDSSGDFAPGAEIPLTPVVSLTDRLGVGAIDPLLARLGAIVLVGVLLVPVALALRPSPTSAETIRTDGSVAAQPVGAAVALDASGNLLEWCSTSWRENYEKPADDDLEGSAGRVLRGGSFAGNGISARCASRLRYHPGGINGLFGFRLVAPFEAL